MIFMAKDLASLLHNSPLKKNNASNFRVFQTRKLRGKLSLNPLSVLRFIELSVRNNQTKFFGCVPIGASFNVTWQCPYQRKSSASL